MLYSIYRGDIVILRKNSLITYIVTQIKYYQTAIKVKMLDVFKFTEFS